VASAGTVTVEAIGYATELRNKSTVISAALIPSMFAMLNALTLNTFPDDPGFDTIAVAVVVAASTSVCPIIVVTFTIFGAAIFIPYPNTIAIAIALPVVMPAVGGSDHTVS
jgi:hypothetical protein